VELELAGPPITTLVCYCDDCQEGSRRIDALPSARTVRDADGGTAYVVYRKDRVRYVKGAQLVQRHKLRESSPTNRVVATCCSSAMVLGFDDAKHWVDVYRARLQGDVPPLEMRVCTRYRPKGAELTPDVPSYEGYPVRFLAKLLTARIGMALRR
jgi:hypothetical protein